MPNLWQKGYTTDELAWAQDRYGLVFPPDLVALLLTKRPAAGYDWRRDHAAIRRDRPTNRGAHLVGAAVTYIRNEEPRIGCGRLVVAGDVPSEKRATRMPDRERRRGADVAMRTADRIGDRRSMDAQPSSSHAGQAVYTPRVLAIYDLLVLGVSNRFIWRCPTPRILALYDRHVSDDHLDVGVGTGWFLDHCRFPSASPRIALLDLNASSLAAAALRIARYDPRAIRADVLAPIAVDTPPFGSISLTYLLHCLPGTIAEKAVALDHLVPLLRPEGVLFGATLLSQGVARSWAAKRLMRTYNEKGIFSNEHDDLDGLRAALGARFEDVELEVAGCGALFAARRPRGRQAAS